MAWMDSITNKLSGGGVSTGSGSIDAQKAVDTLSTSTFTKGFIMFIEGIAVVAIIGAIFYYFYLRFKLYNISIRIWATGSSGSIMVSETRGRINRKTNDMSLWKPRVTLPVPDRKYYIPTSEGQWLINVEKFGAKDFTYCIPAIDETGVILKATESSSRIWAATEWQRTLIKYNQQKFWQTPIFAFMIIGIFFIAALWIILGKLGALGPAFQSAGDHCAELVKELTVLQQQGAGSLVQK